MPDLETNDKKTILLVDDSPERASSFQGFFELMDLNVNWRHTADQARVYLEKQTPDLVILDGNLGDGKFDHSSLSGQLAQELIDKGQRFGRFSFTSESIPHDLRGEFCFGDLEPLASWVEENL